ncbi:EsaB/YukD family protein, partial [Pseudonocardia nigra]|uniref:EsaB/YukD family protein n=1 Tax=Pseudonocardia nigra TaxID=1921578 RepID=UPI001C5D4659
MPATDAAHCRVTVLAPRRRVDVALPADIPVAELVPMVLELVGEPVFGLRPEPWRLSGVAGGPLPSAATLTELGVLDGELLRIAPDAPAPAPPVFDDPVDALAATAAADSPADRRFGAAAVLVVAAA